VIPIDDARAVITDGIKLLVPYARALAQRFGSGDETALVEYRCTLETLAKLAAFGAPNDRPLMTTAELAARLNISAKTVLRKRKSGVLVPAKVLGRRGTGALRWTAPA